MGDLIAAIRDRFGRIDVIEYGPISGEQGFSPATKLDAATLGKGSLAAARSRRDG